MTRFFTSSRLVCACVCVCSDAAPSPSNEPISPDILSSLLTAPYPHVHHSHVHSVMAKKARQRISYGMHLLRSPIPPSLPLCCRDPGCPDPARGSCCAAVVACEQYPWGMSPFHRPGLLSLTSCVPLPSPRTRRQAGRRPQARCQWPRRRPRPVNPVSPRALAQPTRQIGNPPICSLR